MGRGFASRVNRVIWQSDIVIEVVDARFPEETRNSALETKVIESGKKLIVAINKADLVSKERAKRAKRGISKPAVCVFLSAKDKKGINRIMREIGIAKGKTAVVGVIGYPNTGKSSLINALKGKKVARTSKRAGFTRGEQLVRLNQEVMLVDSPGVIPFGERDEFRLFLVGAKNVQDLSDKEFAALKLIEFIQKNNPKELKKKYGIVGKGEKVLEEIAIKRKKLSTGAVPDLNAAARIILEDWSKGKLKT